MIERIFWALGKKVGSIGKVTSSHVPNSIANDIYELEHDGLVSNEYLRGLIARARSKDQLGRILHYFDHNNTGNLTENQWEALRGLIFERFKNMQLAKLLEHLDLIIMHLF